MQPKISWCINQTTQLYFKEAMNLLMWYNKRDVPGTQHIERFFSQIVATHLLSKGGISSKIFRCGLFPLFFCRAFAKNFPPSCTSRPSPRLYFFPQYLVSQIKTPIFFVNATI
ncbi:hypothetical protein HN51_021571 [Arachis hypogaea]